MGWATGDGFQIDNIVCEGGTPATIFAYFSMDKWSGYEPLTIQFTDTSVGDPTRWHWDFGDGGSSDQQNPSYTYQEAGVYSPTLTIYKNEEMAISESGYVNVANDPAQSYGSSTTSVKLDNVIPLGGTHITFFFTIQSGFYGWWGVTDGSGIAPLNVGSTSNGATMGFNISSNSLMFYTKKNGTLNSSGGFTHALTIGQEYKMDIEIWENGDVYFYLDGSLVCTKYNAISPSVFVGLQFYKGSGSGSISSMTAGMRTLPPTASFTYTYDGSTVFLTDTSSNTPTDWIWIVNGTTISSEQTASFTTNRGLYNINLVASNAGGSDETDIDITLLSLHSSLEFSKYITDSGNVILHGTMSDNGTYINIPVTLNGNIVYGSTLSLAVHRGIYLITYLHNRIRRIKG
jgi:PKD repeat protein